MAPSKKRVNANASPSKNKSPTVYFGYGSNLWLHQMSLRCPTSEYRGVARLNGYKWVINDRGYANVVQKGAQKSDHVYGLVYSLLPADEARLDVNEGVPIAYTKEWLDVDFWPGHLNVNGGRAELTTKPEKAKMLVYIDRKRLDPDEPKEEYIHRMNKGIEDAINMGVPMDYVDTYMRPFIPKKSRKSIEDLANKQAMNFADEN